MAASVLGVPRPQNRVLGHVVQMHMSSRRTCVRQAPRFDRLRGPAGAEVAAPPGVRRMPMVSINEDCA